MKYVALLLLVVLFGCKSADDKTVVFLNAGLECANQRIVSLNERTCALAEVNAIENPDRNKIYKICVDKIHSSSELVFQAIVNNTKLLDGDIIDDKNVENQEFKLVDIIENFTFLIDSLFPHDSILQREKDNLLNVRELKNNKYSLKQLENRVLCISHNIFVHSNQKMETPRMNVNKLEAVVIPRAKYLNYGENYEATIALLGYDTMCVMNVLVDDEPLTINNGKAIFIDTLSHAAKSISRNGIIELGTLYSNYKYYYAFKLSYQFVEK